MITTDDRVAEVIQKATKFIGEEEHSHFNKGEQIPFDLVVTPIATGSKDYIQWVKKQCIKKDSAAAFYNTGPEDAIAPDTTTVESPKPAAKSTDTEEPAAKSTETEAKSTESAKSDSGSSTVQVDEDTT